MAKPRLRLLYFVIFFIQQQVSADVGPGTVFLPSAARVSPALPSLLLSPSKRGIESPGSVSITSRAYEGELEAVIAASQLYNPRSIEEDREYMGAVLQKGNDYHYTVAPGEAGEDRITVRVAVPAGASIVAFWHTHGAEAHAREYFSEVDTKLVADWKLPLYLADYTGVLKVFNPGDQVLPVKMAQAHGLPPKRGFATGRIVADDSGDTVKVATGLPAHNLLGRVEMEQARQE